MAKKLTEKEIIELLVTFILENSADMIACTEYERAWLKLEEINEKAIKQIKEKQR